MDWNVDELAELTRQGIQRLKDRYRNPADGEGVALSGSFKKGGLVKKTGVYKLHKGERVLTKQQAKKIRERANGK